MQIDISKVEGTSDAHVPLLRKGVSDSVVVGNGRTHSALGILYSLHSSTPGDGVSVTLIGIFPGFRKKSCKKKRKEKLECVPVLGLGVRLVTLQARRHTGIHTKRKKKVLVRTWMDDLIPNFSLSVVVSSCCFI